MHTGNGEHILHILQGRREGVDGIKVGLLGMTEAAINMRFLVVPFQGDSKSFL